MEPRRAGPGGLSERPSRHTRQRAMYEDLMADAIGSCDHLAVAGSNRRMRKTACPVVWEGG